MTSNAPNHVFVARPAAAAAVVHRHGFVAWLLAWLQHSICALHGHDAILQYERSRIFLRCTSCGFESPGWEIAPNASPLRRYPAEARSPRAGAGDLAIVRKIA